MAVFVDLNKPKSIVEAQQLEKPRFSLEIFVDWFGFLTLTKSKVLAGFGFMSVINGTVCRGAAWFKSKDVVTRAVTHSWTQLRLFINSEIGVQRRWSLSNMIKLKRFGQISQVY